MTETVEPSWTTKDLWSGNVNLWECSIADLSEIATQARTWPNSAKMDNVRLAIYAVLGAKAAAESAEATRELARGSQTSNNKLLESSESLVRVTWWLVAGTLVVAIAAVAAMFIV